MANGSFFVSWELWQQMTLALAFGIVAVFCAGLMRLWWNNRLMRKQEVLDEEKRARLEEMRRTGIPAKRANHIPFGIRAIEGGVEVDGIWISRPASSSGTAAEKIPLVSSTALVDENSESTTPMTQERVSARQNAPDASIFQRLAHNAHSLEATERAASPVSHFVSQTRRPPLRTISPLNEDTLRRLEGQAQPSRLPYETYRPTSPQLIPHQAGHQSSGSSSGDSVGSQTRSARSVSGKSASSQSSRLYTTRQPREGRYAYGNIPQTRGDQEPQNPFRTPSGLSVAPNTVARGRQDLAPPQPTLNPGDLHLNRSSRKGQQHF
ncbi:hypothetical protein QBC35DRAFT_469538 [Podospora australis]|uniref:Uncharacterized protein n=1 Tax=Podospora australis TaxID=1536484 RepID=A0AAN6X3G8_9PEZI|nr:hypothetical protein QBC35DRAFT_469538 [Podospora australis]